MYPDAMEMEFLIRNQPRNEAIEFSYKSPWH